MAYEGRAAPRDHVTTEHHLLPEDHPSHRVQTLQHGETHKARGTEGQRQPSPGEDTE